MDRSGWGAVVLTGGTGRRLGGAAKAGLRLDGTSFLDRSLGAVAGADAVVVVGPEAAVGTPVTFTREQPPGSGPAAAMLHGTALLPASCEVVVVLAVDMPLVGPGTVTRLRDALAGSREHDAALLDDGRPQPLCAAYRRPALLAADPGAAERVGMPVHRLLGEVRTLAVPARGPEGLDVDAPGDLETVREAIWVLHDGGGDGESSVS